MSAVSKLIVANLKRDVRRAWLLRTSEIAHTLVVVRRGTTVQSTLAILLCVVRVVVCSSFMPDGSPLLRSRLVVVGFSDGVNYAPILGPNFSSFTLFEKSKSVCRIWNTEVFFIFILTLISDKFSMWSSYHPDMTTTKQKTKIRAYRYYKTDSITT